jgi:PAS domain S-box-containing protein
MTNTATVIQGQEVLFGDDELIVSKTDLKGRILYCNTTFMRVSGYTESELLGAPHSLLRHPAMPRCIFKLLWETISDGREMFAYVVNRTRNGGYYWVFAHVTPSFDGDGTVIGYHSNRRKPLTGAVRTIESLYRQLLDIESRSHDRKEGMLAAYQALFDILKEKGVGYDEFILAL